MFDKNLGCSGQSYPYVSVETVSFHRSDASEAGGPGGAPSPCFSPVHVGQVLPGHHPTDVAVFQLAGE